jgi:hypothetical protein
MTVIVLMSSVIGGAEATGFVGGGRTKGGKAYCSGELLVEAALCSGERLVEAAVWRLFRRTNANARMTNRARMPPPTPTQTHTEIGISLLEFSETKHCEADCA